MLCGLTMLVLAIACSADLRRRLLALHWVLGLVIVVAVSAPWFIYMYVRFKDGFVNGYILDENIRLFASSRFANQPGFWFLLPDSRRGAAAVDRPARRPLVDDVREPSGAASGSTASRSLLWAWTFADRRLLHAVDVQARSLRVSGGAGAVPAVRARLVRCARPSWRPRGTGRRAWGCT